MENKLLHLRVPNPLYKKINTLVHKRGFRNAQDFTLDALRKSVFSKMTTEEAIAELRKSQGSMKNIKRLTHEEREKIAREMTPEKELQLLREFGLD